MSTSPYSLDLREKVIEYLKKGNNQAKTAEIFNLHRNTINRWVQKYQKFGDLTPKKRHGLKSKLNLAEVVQFIHKHKNCSLKDIASQFKISSAWASIIIRKLGYRYKKKAYTYLEACPQKRTVFRQIVADTPKDKLVYVDESGIDSTDRKQRGWSKIGQVLEGKKSGKSYHRTNIIAGYVNGDTIAPLVFNGSCDTKLVVQWVRECLIKELKPGQIVIMDNAAFHKSDKIREAIESVGCKLLYLPPYSPDLNPIEKFWANMKRWIRSNIDLFANLLEALVGFFNAPNAS